jgi:hypothetical protein
MTANTSTSSTNSKWEHLPPALRLAAIKAEEKRLRGAKQNAGQTAAAMKLLKLQHLRNKRGAVVKKEKEQQQQQQQRPATVVSSSSICSDAIAPPRKSAWELREEAKRKAGWSAPAGWSAVNSSSSPVVAVGTTVTVVERASSSEQQQNDLLAQQREQLQRETKQRLAQAQEAKQRKEQGKLEKESNNDQAQPEVSVPKRRASQMKVEAEVERQAQELTRRIAQDNSRRQKEQTETEAKHKLEKGWERSAPVGGGENTKKLKTRQQSSCPFKPSKEIAAPNPDADGDGDDHQHHYSYHVLQKKLAKTDKLLIDCLTTEGNESKAFLKLKKKRVEYAAKMDAAKEQAEMEQEKEQEEADTERELELIQANNKRLLQQQEVAARAAQQAANEKVAKEKASQRERERAQAKQVMEHALAKQAADKQSLADELAAAKEEAIRREQERAKAAAAAAAAVADEQSLADELAAAKEEAIRREQERAKVAAEAKESAEKQSLAAELAAATEEAIRREREQLTVAEDKEVQRNKQEDAAVAAAAAEDHASERAIGELEQAQAECKRREERQHQEQAKKLKDQAGAKGQPTSLAEQGSAAADSTKTLLKELENVEKLQKKLTVQLNQNGIQISEDIPYDVAKVKISQLTDEMKILAAQSNEDPKARLMYYQLEEQMQKYVTALMLTDEWAEEQAMAEQKWEADIHADNVAALSKVRRHMPVHVRSMTEDELTSEPTPNGKTLPKAIVRKFKRTNIMQLVRMDPEEMERMHPSLLEGMRTTGLTLTERRALYEHLKNVGAKWQSMKQDPMIERKWTWFTSLKHRFQSDLNSYQKHVEQYGPPDKHAGCLLLGNQCPLKADYAIDYSGDYGYTSEAKYETSQTHKSTLLDSPSSTSSTMIVVKKGSLSAANTSHNEIIDSIRDRLGIRGQLSDTDKNLLQELVHAERRAKTLEKQLVHAGIKVADDNISYSVATEQIAELTDEIKIVAGGMGTTTDLKEQGRLETEYVRLSEELEKYNNALMLTKEWAQEQKEKELQWEATIQVENQKALKKLRRHMPVNIRDMSENELTSHSTPNGKKLPEAMVRKFKRTNVLLLVRMDPKAIEPMHPSSLEAMRTTGLTLTERRALYDHLKDIGSKWKAQAGDKMIERKWMWYESLKGKFRETLEKYEKHVEQYGQPGSHPYATRNDPTSGCPLLGNQCPLKADMTMDYSGDYGFSEEAQYDISEVQKSNLLSVEEFQARNEPADGGNQRPKSAIGGMLKEIFAGGP